MILPPPILYGIYFSEGGSGGHKILRNSVGDEGGGWGAQTQGVFAQNIIDVCKKASKWNESLVKDKPQAISWLSSFSFSFQGIEGMFFAARTFIQKLGTTCHRLIVDLTLPFTLTSARPPTRAWEVARTVVAPPSSVVKCLWEVLVGGLGGCSCRVRVCVGVGGVVLCRCVCLWPVDLFLLLGHRRNVLRRAHFHPKAGYHTWCGGHGVLDFVRGDRNTDVCRWGEQQKVY